MLVCIFKGVQVKKKGLGVREAIFTGATQSSLKMGDRLFSDIKIWVWLWFSKCKEVIRCMPGNTDKKIPILILLHSFRLLSL